jgi:hypothetical protein
MSVFCFIVTDLVLIYESATTSASVVRWLTLHSLWLSQPFKVKVKVTLRLAICRESVLLDVKPLETHDQ